MIAIVQAQAGNRFIGEIDTRGLASNPVAGDTVTLLWPMAYIEKPQQGGLPLVLLPPPILATPLAEMSIVASVLMPLAGSTASQLISAYEAATAPVRAAVTGIVPAAPGDLRRFRQGPPTGVI